MAKHDDAAGEAEPLDRDVAVEHDDGHDTKRAPARLRWVSQPLAVALTIVAALSGLGGWLGFRLHQDHRVHDQHSLYVQVARQTAINLTTISYAEVDADIKRVLDSATGAFHDEFQNRSGPFVEVVKKVQSKTEGSISEAGLLSASDDQAQVLIAVAVKTSMAASPNDQEPRRWRMKLTVDKTGDGAKVSNVEFVP